MMNELQQGRIKTTYVRDVCDGCKGDGSVRYMHPSGPIGIGPSRACIVCDGKTIARIPTGYVCVKSTSPNCLFCPGCDTAAAEVWKVKGSKDWMWCTRHPGEHGKAPSRDAAVSAARKSVGRTGYSCMCSEEVRAAS